MKPSHSFAYDRIVRSNEDKASPEPQRGITFADALSSKRRSSAASPSLPVSNTGKLSVNINGVEPVLPSAPADAFSNHMAMQQSAMEQQDEMLEDMSTVVTRLQAMSVEMGSELEMQNHMIQDVSSHVDETQQKIDQLSAKVQKMLDNMGYGPCCLVLALSALACLLVLLIVFT